MRITTMNNGSSTHYPELNNDDYSVLTGSGNWKGGVFLENAPNDPLYFEAYQVSSTGISIRFKVSDTQITDTLGNSVVIASIKTVIVVRKANAVPSSVNDGTVIITLNHTTMNNYAETAYVDTGLTLNTTYYYRIFITSTEGIVNDSITDSQKFSTTYAHIYGFKINKNESDPYTRVVYTDDSSNFNAMSVTTDTVTWGSWQDTFVIKSFRPVALKYDGTVDYELNHDDQTLKLSGGSSDISNDAYEGNMMVEVKKMYYYCYEDAEYEYFKVADYKVNENYKSFAFIDDNGIEKDAIYLPMFKGSNVNSKLRSIAGKTSCNTTGGSNNEIIWAQNLGAGWYTIDYSVWSLIANLLILLGKSTNTQARFGNGHYTGGSSASNLLQTGTLKDKGMFYGDPSDNIAVKVFWLENWYGDRWDRCAGIKTSAAAQIIVKPSRPYNGDSTEGYVETGSTPSGTSGGYVSRMKMTPYGLVPLVISGSDSTYYTDGFWYAANCYGVVGGACYNGLQVGALCLNLDTSFGISFWGIGASPTFK